MNTAVSTTMADPRLEAFSAYDSPEVFHGISYWSEVWKEDPFDVDIIHQKARETFTRMLNKAVSDEGASGRILLIKGEAGAGKTHLMRAFRNMTHSKKLGYFGYMQLSSQTGNYSQYLLGNLIDSLSEPYYISEESTSGLTRLSNALANAYVQMDAHESEAVENLRKLWEEDLGEEELNRLIYEIAESIVCIPKFERIDIDIVRALLYLQYMRPNLNNLVMKYLRCEDLGRYQRDKLGDIVPKTLEQDPLYVIEMLGRLMRLLHNNCLVVCLDQLEGIFIHEGAQSKFQRAMGAVCDLVNRVPSSIFVICCLEDYYIQLRDSLNRPALDRIEKDPAPILLEAHRTLEEIELMVQYRLQYLYETKNAPHSDQDPLFPFQREQLAKLENSTTRNVLGWCLHFQNEARRQSRIPVDVKEPAPEEPPSITNPKMINLSEEWATLKATSKNIPDLTETEIVNILAQTLSILPAEIDGDPLSPNIHGHHVYIEGWHEKLLIGLCNKKAQGGGLMRELEELKSCAKDRRMVIVRTAEYPRTPNSIVSKFLGTLIAEGARRVTVEDSDLRIMHCFQQFQKSHGQQPGFSDWLSTEKPLSRLPSIQQMLDLANRPKPVERNEVETPTLPATREHLPSLNEDTIPLIKTSETEFLVGMAGQFRPQPVLMNLKQFTTHSAFIGGSGSGKTTIAMHIIEQMLLRGIPAVLLDRKGDLCRYAAPDVWNEDEDNHKEERCRLRNRVHASLFTPGQISGRHLFIPLVPEGASKLPSQERRRIAEYSATSLCRMMNLQLKSNQNQQLLVILTIAIDQLMEIQPGAITLEVIIQYIASHDPILLSGIGQLDTKNFKKLVDNLETLRFLQNRLLDNRGEHLDFDALFNPAPEGKTRLTVISTKFLNDLDLEFWVAQFLVELMQWGSRHPSTELQAVVLFDEADRYLPTVSKPATKEPMENLLRRARSAGLGMMLATQSPGDFDYKCRDNIRTWFLGRVKEETALKKIDPMLSEWSLNAHEILPNQNAGQFVLVREGKTERIQAQRCLISPQQLPEERILELAKQQIK